MKIVTNSVLTVNLDNSNDRDTLNALAQIAKRDKTTLHEAFNGVLSNFFISGGEPPEANQNCGKPSKY